MPPIIKEFGDLVADPQMSSYVNSWTAYWCGGLSGLAYCNGLDQVQVLNNLRGVAPVEQIGWLPAAGDFFADVFYVRMAGINYVAFQGTRSVKQAMLYLLANGIDTFGGNADIWAFRPFAMQTAAAFQRVRQACWPNGPVIFTGHSLGGAMAAIFALMGKIAGLDVRAAYTFGAPKVGSPLGAEMTADYVYRYFSPNDVIPRTPPSGAPYHIPFVYDSLAISNIQHWGQGIELGNVNAQEIAGEVSAEVMRDISKAATVSVISEHMMGAYMVKLLEGIEPSLVPAFGNFIGMLRAQNVHGLSLAAWQAQNGTATPESYAAIQAAEDAETQAMVTGNRNVRVRLYVAPETLPPVVRLNQIQEASFPGYAPIPWQDGKSWDPKGLASGNVFKSRFTFKLTGELANPLHVVGAYVTETINGVETLIGIKPFELTSTVWNRNDQITVGGELSVGQVD
jgi:hypothetical protein